MFKLGTYCRFTFQNAKFFLLALLLTSIGATTLTAQTFSGTPRPFQSLLLGKKFKQYEVFQLDARALAQTVQAESSVAELDLELGSQQWTLALWPNDIVSPKYTLRVLKPDGSIEASTPAQKKKAFKGIEKKGGGQVRLTIDDNFLYGFVEYKGETWYIEPLYDFVSGSDQDLYILYPQSGVVRGEGVVCGTEITEEMTRKYEEDAKQHTKGEGAESTSMACYEADLAIASDRLMFNKYGSNVENHNIAVINTITPNYASSFIHVIQFNIVTQFVVTGTDPWTSSTVPDQLLTSFQAWGNAGNFGVPFDIGELWTDRDFNGGVIGIAFLSGVCNSLKYHCLQDFSSNADFLRVLTAHEIGHNFSCFHDASGCPGGFIMCPSVNTSNTWSSASINSVNNFLPGLINTCLAPCGSGGGGGGGQTTPPTADFSWAPDPACAGQPVTFTDLSTGTYQTRAWVFPGGTPTSSTQANPTVTWNTAGTYNVRLTVGGTNGTSTIVKQVVVQGLPNPNFTFVVNGTSVTFTNTTPGAANTYLWNFGDGNTSTEVNPVHDYAVGGNYTVTLTATNNCGSRSVSKQVNTIPTPDFSATPVSGCPPLVVHFTNLSTANATSYQWQFPGGTPATSTVLNPTVTYAQPGQYDVTLIATNAVGADFITKQNFITVQDPPIANFTFTQVGRTVTFTNTSTNATGYSWNFGDNTPVSTQANPVHTYANPGTYTVTLSVSGPCGSDAFAQTVVIVPAPAASFTAANRTGCAPFTVQYTNTTTGNPTAFSWSFPGGSPATSTDENPVVTYNTSGSYSVTLVASNNGGSSTATQANYITVGPAPVPSFGVTVGTISVSFLNTSTNSISYSWDFGDGVTSTLTNPTHTYSADGTYEVVLTATNSCGTATASRQVIILTPPTAGFSVANRTGCAPFSVTFNNTSSANAGAFNWQFPGGTPATSTAQNPTVVYNTPGSYGVTLTVSNAAGSNTATQSNYITVGPPPAAAFTSSVSGLNATFTNNSVNAISYLWNFGNGNTSTQANPATTYATDGVYTVTLTATNACGSNTTTQTVVIVTPPTAGFTASNTNGCGPLQVQYTSTASANATTFNWQFAGGNPSTSTDQNPTVVYTTPGNYTALLTVSNSAGSSSTVQVNVVTVQPLPTAVFSYSGSGATVTFTNTSANATSYLWNFGNGNTNTAANPTYTYPTDGIYTVTLTATGTCGTATATQTVLIVTPPTAGFTVSNANGCAPLAVQYTNTASANATSFSWEFPGGSPATSVLQNPVVVYDAPGTYSATLTVSNAAGNNSSTQTNIVVATGGPTASFAHTGNGTQVTFANNSANATTYLWAFGDGNTGTQANPVHTYAGDGVYSVTLTATNACGSTSATQVVIVVTPPTAGFTATNTAGCAPLSVQYTSTASANTTTYNWDFPGGTPANSTDQNPVVVYSAPGTYTAVLRVSNAAGSDTLTQTNLVTATGAPTTAFTHLVNGAVVTFTNSSANATGYLWNFGNGQNSTDANPTYSYPTDGTYTVTLTATNACGATTSTQTIVIVTPPTAGFTATNAVGCSPLSVQYTSTSSANTTSFSWQFPGGTPATSTEQHPVVLYNVPGTYAATLTVSNAAGTNTVSQAGVATVTGGPSSGFSATVDLFTATFVNLSSNASTYLWNFGDGSGSADPNPSHTYTADGTYLVTLTATNACGSNVFTQNVVVLTLPTAVFTANTTAGCGPLTVQFTDLSTSNTTSWNWSFPGGTPSTSTQQNPVVVYETPGVYDVTLVASTGAGSSTFTRTAFISVGSTPVAGFQESANGANIQFANNTSNANSYLWNFGDGNTSTEEHPAHLYGASGNFTVTLVATNPCGSDTITRQIVVAGPPPVAAFSANSTNGCSPLTVHFADLSTGTPVAWTWLFQGGTPSISTEQNPTVVYNTAGSYAVVLRVVNSYGADTLIQTNYVQVRSAPLTNFATAINGATVSFTNLTPGVTTFAWNFGDNTSSNIANPVHVYTLPGTYTVRLTTTNDCGSNTTERTIQVIFTGTENLADVWKMRVFPNPNEGMFAVEVHNLPSEEVQLTLFNALGQLVGQEMLHFDQTQTIQRFDYRHVAAGVYSLRLQAGARTAVVPLVIQQH